jgi:hypothetical protein
MELSLEHFNGVFFTSFQCIKFVFDLSLVFVLLRRVFDALRLWWFYFAFPPDRRPYYVPTILLFTTALGWRIKRGFPTSG